MYGTEDTDLLERFEKSGYSIYWTLEPDYYHLWHPPGKLGGHEALYSNPAAPMILLIQVCSESNYDKCMYDCNIELVDVTT